MILQPPGDQCSIRQAASAAGGAFLATVEHFRGAKAHVIRLIVINEQGEGAIVASAPYFRITGGAVWTGRRHPGDAPLVRLVSGRWQYALREWVGVRFEGTCRLIFGLPREPSSVSDVLQGVSISDGTLAASGIPFAIYDEAREMWRGVTANTWWHAFRIEAVALRDSSARSDAEQGSLENPWGGSAFRETRVNLN